MRRRCPVTSEEHLAKAEYYARIFDKTWDMALSEPYTYSPSSLVDTSYNDNVLRAGELHLKLAEAKCTVDPDEVVRLRRENAKMQAKIEADC